VNEEAVAHWGCRAETNKGNCNKSISSVGNAAQFLMVLVIALTVLSTDKPHFCTPVPNTGTVSIFGFIGSEGGLFGFHTIITLLPGPCLS
jgi:hypothetical protein